MDTTTHTTVYLTGPQVKHRYQCSYQTIWRWTRDPDLGFPQPLKINGRNRFALNEIEAFERRRAVTQSAA